jgi:O-antigen ligase
MSARMQAAATAATAVGIGLVLVLLILMPVWGANLATALYVPAVAVVVLVSGSILVWFLDPAYTLSAAIFLTPLAGHWPQLGVPGSLSPDRLLFVGAVVAVALRAPPVADRPRLRITGIHLLLALAAAFALVSALFAGTLFQREPFFKLFDAFGILPFLIFLVAPVAFRTPHQRRVLLGTFVALGAYLGLTTLFETLKLDALVFPKYILDATYGIHVGRGRGPFVDAVANGLALYTCAVMCAVAVASWRSRRMRAVAAGIGLLCVVGSFLCLERSVWIGAGVGTTIAMCAIPETRRYFLPVIVAVAVAVVAALTLVPGLSERAAERANNQGTIWERQNLTRAALNMIKVKPLFGFGWSRFASDSSDYFEQAPDYPLATPPGEPLHNTPLTYAVELGLIGLSFWLLGLVLGVGGALATRGPPDLLPWRIGLLAVAGAFVVVMNAVPPTAWANRSLWLLAGAIYGGRIQLASTRATAAH